MNKLLKIAGICIAVGLVFLFAVLAWFWLELRASRPILAGARALSGLSAQVSVERDDLGVPTIKSANRRDATRTMGYLHAQDRFFQMDLTRRAGSGTLAELLGPALLKTDRQLRLHRLRQVAQKTMALLPSVQVDHLRAFAEGVNEGLARFSADGKISANDEFCQRTPLDRQ